MTIPLFLVPILAGLIAQALKPVLNKEWRQEQATRKDLRPRYGGMPSAHTAFATSLATIVSLVEGMGSASFALSISILIFILDDALRLRVFLGRFGRVLNRTIPLLPESERKDLPDIEQRIGHTVPEVIGGAIVGILVSVCIWLLDQ